MCQENLKMQNKQMQNYNKKIQSNLIEKYKKIKCKTTKNTNYKKQGNTKLQTDKCNCYEHCYA